MLSFQAACFQKSEPSTPAGQLIPWRLTANWEFPAAAQTRVYPLTSLEEICRAPADLSSCAVRR